MIHAVLADNHEIHFAMDSPKPNLVNVGMQIKSEQQLFREQMEALSIPVYKMKDLSMFQEKYPGYINSGQVRLYINGLWQSPVINSLGIFWK